MSTMIKPVSRPSAHDVARLAGVSQAAVSRAFTPGASISDQTRTKVLKAAEELGYRPNLLARSLITGKSQIVGVVMGSPRNPFYLEALDHLSVRLGRAGKHLLIFTARPGCDADEMVEALLSFRVESLILMSASLSPAFAEKCRHEGIPVIFFSRRAKTLAGFPSVTSANHLGGERMARHLLERGYRNLAFMGGHPESSTSIERGAGFADALARQGYAPPPVEYGNYDRLGSVEATRRLLSLSPRPDAIFCANDMMALSAIETARYDFGLEIGRELGIAGYDDIEGASWRSFNLTTYAQPIETMIARTIEIIVAPGEFADAPHVEVEGELKVRESTFRG